MTMSSAQTWGATTGSSSGTPPILTRNLAAVPSAGSLIVAFFNVNGGYTRTAAISDNMTDGGSWVIPNSQSLANLAANYYSAYKIVGASANINSTITITTSVAAGTEIFTGVYNPGTGASFSTDGSPYYNSGYNTNSTNPDPGPITILANSLIVGFSATGSYRATAGGTTFVRQVTTGTYNDDGVEDNIAAVVAGTQASGAIHASWVEGTNDTWVALSVAFKSTSGGGSGLLMRRRRESGMFQRRDDNWEKKSGLWQMNKRLAA